MNRDIKFRAWVDGKRMLLPTRTELEISLRGLTQGTDFILLQYTGLKDKNGKEIYEGDILEYYGAMLAKGEPPRISPVVWAGWHWEGIRNWRECKVIGNIWENPELLEAKT